MKVVVADVFHTGYDACELADVSPGETVAVYGGGPVGLMAACSASIRGASRVFVVDRIPERLSKARALLALLDRLVADRVDALVGAGAGRSAPRSARPDRPARS